MSLKDRCGMEDGAGVGEFLKNVTNRKSYKNTKYKIMLIISKVGRQ